MATSILVPIAPSQTASGSAALALAADFAKTRDGKITVLSVIEDAGPLFWVAPREIVERNRAAAMKAVRDVVAAQDMVDDDDIVFLDGHPARAILDYARDMKIDMIVMASHDPVLADYVLGSVAAHVVAHARCSVLVVRNRLAQPNHSG